MRTPETTEAEQAVEAAPIEQPLLQETAQERVLLLQRTAGNAVVAQMLSRRGATEEAEAPPRQRDERVSLTDVKFACFFIPASDPRVGAPMRKLQKLSGGGHIEINAASLEDAMVQMASRVKGRKDIRIAEIVLVAHGRPQGRIDIPITPGGKPITPETLIALRDSFKASSGGGRFQTARSAVIGQLDEGSQVVVKGCRAGLNEALVWNLTAFFGGQASVYVPKVFFGVDELTIGGPLLKDAIAAYDFLESKGLIPYGTAYDDDGKKAWVRTHLPNGKVPEVYLLDVDQKLHDELIARHHPDDPEVQKYKDFEGAQLIGIEKWSEGRSGVQGRDDEMEDRKTPELVALAREHLNRLRSLETAGDDWKAIGYEAWLVLRAHRVWSARGAGLDAPAQNGDPLAGLTIPGLSYDTNALAMQAGRRGDLRLTHEDIWLTAELYESPTPVDLTAPAEGSSMGHEDPSTRADEKVASTTGALQKKGQELLDGIANEESLDRPDEQKIAIMARALLRLHDQWSKGPGISAALSDTSGDPLAGLYIPGLSYDTTLLSMKAAKYRPPSAKPKPAPKPTAPPDLPAGPDPPMPDFDDVHLFPETADAANAKNKPSKPPLGGIVRPANIKFKVPIPGTKDKPMGEYFTLKGFSLDVEAYAEIGPKGEAEFTGATLASYEVGKGWQYGAKGDAKLVDARFDGDWYVKLKGGWEVTDSAPGLGKREVAFTLEWGNIAKEGGHGYIGEAKAFCSYDTQKGELRVAGIKLVPGGYQGEIPIKLADGAQITAKGTIKPTFDIQPNWPKIAAKLGLRFAGTAAAGAGTGTTIATGFAAVGAAEAVVLTAGAAGIVLVVAVYCKEMKDWQDIKQMYPRAEDASRQLRAGYASAFGLSDQGSGPFFDKGKELGAMMQRKMAERMVKGWEAKNPGKTAPFTVADAEAETRKWIAESAEYQQGLRSYAFGAFDKWIKAEFYRQWSVYHPKDKNDWKARAYMLGNDRDDPPEKPDWSFTPEAEPRVIEEPF